MYKPDYSAAPSTGGTAKQTTNNKNSLGEAKLDVMNTNYEVFKCLYNKEDIAPGANTAQNMPTTANNYATVSYTHLRAHET